MNSLPFSPQKAASNANVSGLPSYASILGEICQELGVQIQWVSNNWVAILEKGQQRRFIMGYKFDINPSVSTMIADDKFATFEVLKRSGVPTINHALLYDKNNHKSYARGRNTRAYLEEFLKVNHGHIVIKPNNGYCGYGVYQAENIEEAERAAGEIFCKHDSASICPFYEMKFEYRLIILDGEAKLVYKKVRGEDWRFNLCQGAKAEKIGDSELYDRLYQIVLKAVQALNMRFCSVDIIETIEGELLVMEVNAGVMTEGYLAQHPESYETIKQIYAGAIEKMFAES